MAFYCETIESSKTWTCPKTGVWKVICIGGGGGGYGYYLQNSVTCEAAGGSGGTTSFGSYLSAAGGAAGSSAKGFETYAVQGGNYLKGSSGVNGYNGAAAYGTKNNMSVGYGYGASGGCYNTTTQGLISSGDPGDIKTCILDLTADTAVVCTIGAAGKGASGESAYATITAYAGKAGAIVVQYLGSSF